MHSKLKLVAEAKCSFLLLRRIGEEETTQCIRPSRIQTLETLRFQKVSQENPRLSRDDQGEKEFQISIQLHCLDVDAEIAMDHIFENRIQLFVIGRI